LYPTVTEHQCKGKKYVYEFHEKKPFTSDPMSWLPVESPEKIMNEKTFSFQQMGALLSK
jgi:hypothetical protein